MTGKREDLARFARVVESYGAEPARWPAPERAALAGLPERWPEARALLRQAAALDGLLDSQTVSSPLPALRASILAAAPTVADRPSRRRQAWRAVCELLTPVALRPTGAILAASLLLGVVAGGLLPILPQDTVRSDRAAGTHDGGSLLQFALMDDRYAGY